MRIDLHTHSTCSDGTETPAELMASASRARLDVVALTDHDTTAGWELAEQAMQPGVALVRGTEFSTLVHRGDGRTTSIHLLGYLFDPLDPVIVEEHLRLGLERRKRGLSIVQKMRSDGVPITADQVLDIADGAPVGRPHIGRALVNAGLVQSVDEAFAGYLAGSGPYYVHKVDTELEKAILMIAQAGGVSVIAHPRARGATQVLTPDRLAELATLGLNGLEVLHPDHDEAARAELFQLTQELDLIPTGSSDFHGTNKKLILGQELTPSASLDRIVAAASGVIQVLQT